MKVIYKDKLLLFLIIHIKNQNISENSTITKVCLIHTLGNISYKQNEKKIPYSLSITHIDNAHNVQNVHKPSL